MKDISKLVSQECRAEIEQIAALESKLKTFEAKAAGYDAQAAALKDEIDYLEAQVPGLLAQGKDPGPVGAKKRGLRDQADDLTRWSELLRKNEIPKIGKELETARVALRRKIEEVIEPTRLELSAELQQKIYDLSDFSAEYRLAAREVLAQFGWPQDCGVTRLDIPVNIQAIITAVVFGNSLPRE